MLKLYIPKYEDLWFRKMFLADEATMLYNRQWGGTIDFPEERWDGWYDFWILNSGNKRFYRYLIDENNNFIGEVAYHFDDTYGKYLADTIVYAKYRGNGYGRIGLELLCKAAKDNGLSFLHDNIARDNSAIHLFFDCGFMEEYGTEEIIMLKKAL